MIVLRAQIPLSPAHRSQVVRSLRRVLGQTRVLPGCVSCQLCADVEDDNRLVLVEEWADVQSLRTYLRGDEFKVVLSALDYASDRPEVQLNTVTDTQGMDFVTACRERGQTEE